MRPGDRKLGVISLPARSSSPCHFTAIHTWSLCSALSAPRLCWEKVCVCVLWLISVRGKWKPLISHLSLLRKSCHSLWTRCHLHSFNQDLSHCLTCSCAGILIWGLYARRRFSFLTSGCLSTRMTAPWGENSREFSAKSPSLFRWFGLLPSWMACAFFIRVFVGTMSCQVLKWTKCILHTSYSLHSGSSDFIQVEIIVK